MFVFDLFTQLVTAYEDRRGTISTDLSAIAGRYLLSRIFVVDLLGAIPIIGGYGEARATDGSLLVLFKCLRLWKIGTVGVTLDHHGTQFWRIFRLLFAFLFCAHWLTCAWRYAACGAADVGCYGWLEHQPETKRHGFASYGISAYTVLCMLMGENMSPSSELETTLAYIIVLMGACVQVQLVTVVIECFSLCRCVLCCASRRLCSVNWHMLYPIQTLLAPCTFIAWMQRTIRCIHSVSRHHYNNGFDIFTITSGSGTDSSTGRSSFLRYQSHCRLKFHSI